MKKQNKTQAPSATVKATAKAPSATATVKATAKAPKPPAKAPKPPAKETEAHRVGKALAETLAKAEVKPPAKEFKAGRPDDDAMHAGTVYTLTDEGMANAQALNNGVIVALRCKVQHGESVRWLIRAATVQGIAQGKVEHGALTTHVNQTVAKALIEKGRAHQCKHHNGEPVKWRIGDDARIMAEGGLLTIIEPKRA